MTGSIVANPDLTPATIATVTNETVHEDERMEEEEEVTEDSPDPKWVNLFTKNRAAANGLNLDYISPKLVNGQQVVELVQEEVDKEMHK
ncbi:hypothetical protein KY290_021609 [Solanum tuberosum]|uniref:Uncharacterized protein n=1 Tax=Solanum tuberosum TaxID=4113 RepID=A0ABQ7V251_SOLTU|nr:hypothetical protein KY284_020598 [Solanum tuberosum]KAH0683026.1 hypothetical protein KY289_020778 [Solanum tuberosum]KAH0758116.1 hypothetical protein KY290_021609 [Solanum tuberosum]